MGGFRGFLKNLRGFVHRHASSLTLMLGFTSSVSDYASTKGALALGLVETGALPIALGIEGAFLVECLSILIAQTFIVKAGALWGCEERSLLAALLPALTALGCAINNTLLILTIILGLR